MSAQTVIIPFCPLPYNLRCFGRESEFQLTNLTPHSLAHLHREGTQLATITISGTGESEG